MCIHQTPLTRHPDCMGEEGGNVNGTGGPWETTPRCSQRWWAREREPSRASRDCHGTTRSKQTISDISNKIVECTEPCPKRFHYRDKERERRAKCQVRRARSDEDEQQGSCLSDVRKITGILECLPLSSRNLRQYGWCSSQGFQEKL